VEVFEGLFVRVVSQCVEAGLVNGERIHADASLVDANASTNSVVKGSPAMIEELRERCRSEVKKLDDEQELSRGRKYHATVNDKAMSLTDPDAALVRREGGSRPRYKSHRAVDDAHGVVTAVVSTPGSVKENGQLMGLIEQHERNTAVEVKTVVADSQYGTAENFRSCQERGLRTHMADLLESQEGNTSREGIYPESAFEYDAEKDVYRCPSGQRLSRRNHRESRQASEYAAKRQVCATCGQRALCTRAKTGGRSIKRHVGHDLIQRGREQSRSAEAKKDRRRRKWLMEGSFADAANNHGFKRARWRRLWRQQIQDYVIAAVQNVRILLREMDRPRVAVSQVVQEALGAALSLVCRIFQRLPTAQGLA